MQAPMPMGLGRAAGLEFSLVKTVISRPSPGSK